MLNPATAEELREGLLPDIQQLRDLGSPAQLLDEALQEAVKASLRVEIDLTESVEHIKARLASIEATQDSILAALEGLSGKASPTRGRGKAS